jgi:diphthine-ammonia ligase
MSKPKAVVSWSGGKDSYLALHRTISCFDVQALLTMFTEGGARSRSHGLRPEVVIRQANLLNLCIVSGRASWESYEEEFKRILRDLARDFRIRYAATFSSMNIRRGSNESIRSAALSQ